MARGPPISITTVANTAVVALRARGWERAWNAPRFGLWTAGGMAQNIRKPRGLAVRPRLADLQSKAVTRVQPMRDPGRRIVIAILGVALSLAIAGCAAEDNPPTSRVTRPPPSRSALDPRRAARFDGWSYGGALGGIAISGSIQTIRPQPPLVEFRRAPLAVPVRTPPASSGSP